MDFAILLVIQIIDSVYEPKPCIWAQAVYMSSDTLKNLYNNFIILRTFFLREK